MRHLLIFLLFLNVSDLKAQTPPFYRYQEQIDSVLLSGNSVNLNFLTKAYHAQKSVILDYDPESYDKLKYYDFVLFGDGFSHVAFVNERYLILNDRYEVKKEIDPSPGITSSRLEIFPFVSGLARVKGEQEMLIDGLGNPVQHTVGKKVVQTTRGYFVQTEVDKVVFYQHNHKVLNSWTGVLDRKLNIKQEVVLLKLPEYSVLLKGNGIVFCDSLQSVVELISIDGFYTKSQSGQSVIYDSKGEVSFVSDKNTSQQTRLGLYGGVMVKNGRKGYFDFKKRLFTPLDERDFYPFSAHTFVFRENDMYGFIDFKGKERAAGVYKPLLDYTLEYLSQGDTVYRFFDDKLLKLPVSTKDWMKKKAMGKSLYCFKTDKYRLLDANTGKFLYYEFDTLYNNILGDYVLRNTEIGYSVSSNERFHGFVLEQNGTVMVMDTTFLKQSSPYMDTLYTFGMSLYKFRSQDKKWGYLSSSGAVACSASYEEVFHFGTSHYKVKINGKWGIVDLKEKQIVPAEYDEILKIHTSFLLAKKGKEVYLFDIFGKQLLSEPIKTAEISLVDGKLKCDYLSLKGERNSFWIN